MHYFKIMTSEIMLCVFKVQRNDNSMLNTIKFYLLLLIIISLYLLQLEISTWIFWKLGLSKIMPCSKFQIGRRTEAPRLNFGNRNELRIDYDVESSFGRGGLHFGSPATRFVCRHLIR